MVNMRNKKDYSREILRLVMVLTITLCTACHTGLIPCPKIKTVRMKKNQPHRYFYESQETLSADAKSDVHTKSYKSSDGRSVKNISVEEWDCPRPGEKKYMPKNVRENIKKNMEKINTPEKSAGSNTSQ